MPISSIQRRVFGSSKGAGAGATAEVVCPDPICGPKGYPELDSFVELLGTAVLTVMCELNVLLSRSLRYGPLRSLLSLQRHSRRGEEHILLSSHYLDYH